MFLPTPPHPAPATFPGPAERPRRGGTDSRRRDTGGRGRFASGVALGALVGAAVAGGIVAVARTTDGSPSASVAAPATTGTASGPEAATAGARANVIADLVARTRPSIVAIHDSIQQTNIFGQTLEGQAAGTGFVVSADGYLVTNAHVVDGATGITVDFADQRDVAAELVAADPAADLAVLKVDHGDLTPLPVADADSVQIGEQVVAIGNALDLSGEPTVTTGIVSATDRSITEPNGEHLANLLQTDTAINPGNSGGPLLALDGSVVGINTVIAGQAQNIGFAISMDHASALIDQLVHGEVPEHALLGVSTHPTPGGTDGAVVAEVSAASAAADAGLRRGDVITAVDATPVASPDDLAAAIAAHAPGDHVSVTYERGGSSHDVDVTLGTRPADS